MRVRYVVALTAVAVAAGCASAPPRATTDEVARAQALVGEAEQSGAQQYAAADLQEARDKLQEATALEEKQPIQAQHLARESAVDAQLAAARASDGKAQRAVQDVNASLNTLRNEELRHEQTQPPVTDQTPPPLPPGPPAPVPPPNASQPQ